MSKIYTKTGDEGSTGLFAGPRVSKDHPRIEAYGTVDELSAAIGVALADSVPAEIRDLLVSIQHQLFNVGAVLASPKPEAVEKFMIEQPDVDVLERSIDQFDANLPPLRTFILPGGTPAAAALHLARVVCRRAERRAVTLERTPAESVPPLLVVYLNRLGDLLFVLARAVNHRHETPDVIWQK